VHRTLHCNGVMSRGWRRRGEDQNTKPQVHEWIRNKTQMMNNNLLTVRKSTCHIG
jgi:hypothetical protein